MENASIDVKKSEGQRSEECFNFERYRWILIYWFELFISNDVASIRNQSINPSKFNVFNRKIEGFIRHLITQTL